MEIYRFHSTGDIRWPGETWGYGLGRGVPYLRLFAAKQQLPQVLESQLEEMGFVFHHYQSQWDDSIMPALRHYNKVYGNTDVPQDFVVPSGDNEWPRQTCGFKLGITVSTIRNTNAYSHQVHESEEELKQLKFCYETSISERDWSEKILPALRVFRQERYHCLVGGSFKVPSGSPWPEKAWGLRLGDIVNNVRSGKNYVEQATRDKDFLIELGFSWDYYKSQWGERIFPALAVCAAEFGTFQLSVKFVVPQRDPWPKNMWGMWLGRLVYNMRNQGVYFPYFGRVAARLEALGFRCELKLRPWEDKVVPLLHTYAEVFGNTAIPRDFVIPSESPWPKKMWGVQLGIIVDHNQNLFRE